MVASKLEARKDAKRPRSLAVLNMPPAGMLKPTSRNRVATFTDVFGLRAKACSTAGVILNPVIVSPSGFAMRLATKSGKPENADDRLDLITRSSARPTSENAKFEYTGVLELRGKMRDAPFIASAMAEKFEPISNPQPGTFEPAIATHPSRGTPPENVTSSMSVARGVTGVVGSELNGLRSISSGIYLLRGSARETTPSAASCESASDTKILLMLPMRIAESAVTFAPVVGLAVP
mmetsp:Transcript_113927/g.276653  ORF Transcript_113927/g.276653 Transcript_113927/m.276653 type:complete len:235 (+) Transcript_113927:720-1424(+)